MQVFARLWTRRGKLARVTCDAISVRASHCVGADRKMLVRLVCELRRGTSGSRKRAARGVAGAAPPRRMAAYGRLFYKPGQLKSCPCDEADQTEGGNLKCR